MPNEACAAGARWWFVYYRVRSADLDAAVLAARAAQRALCATQPGLSAELLQRPSSTEGESTLLESYRAEPGWTAQRLAALPAAIEIALGTAVAPWLRGPRRTEVFTPCA